MTVGLRCLVHGMAIALPVAFGVSCNSLDHKTEKDADAIQPLFTDMPADSTGIAFVNAIRQDMSVNLYNFAYLFNGGGVAIGDIDNDGLPDVYFSATLGQDRLFHNLGRFRFEDITAAAGIGEPGGLKTGVTMADVNGDGWLDIYVCRTGKTDNPTLLNNLLFLNNGDLTFTESAEKARLTDRSNTTQAVFFDFDLDGDLDAYLVNHRMDYSNSTRIRLHQGGDGRIARIAKAQTAFESDRLYRNDGDGRFTDVSRSAGIDNSAFGLSASVSDINGDGWPDLFVANDYIDPDFCYINNRNGTFTDRVDEYFRHTSQSSMGSDFADINNDGLPDLVVMEMAAEDNYRQKSLVNVMMYDRYATLEKYGYGRQLGRNVLQINNGNGTFSEIGELSGISRTDWSWAGLFADLDNDGYKDLFVTNGYRYDVTNSDYLNFTLDSLNKNVVLDSREKLDLYLQHIPTARLRNYAYRNLGGLQFADESERWGFGRTTYSNGCAYADLDNDGDLDLVINNIDEPAGVYRNESRQQSAGHFLQVACAGPAKNTFGIGTRVELRTASGKQVMDLYCSRGFMSSVPPVLHFGMGSDSIVQRMIVRWPDGKEEVLKEVRADRHLLVDYKNAVPANPASRSAETEFTEIRTTGIDFVHRENPFVDFKREPLIPHRLSQDGPCLVAGDVNGDGLDDLFIGGAGATPQGGTGNGAGSHGFAGAVFLQQASGGFVRSRQPALEADRDAEDVGATLFDADGDGDPDLYVVSGSTEFPAGNAVYRDRLYLNDGHGAFMRASGALPETAVSGSCVRSADMDGDGDADLFVGSVAVPGSYPLSPACQLLRNDGGRFTDVAPETLPQQGRLGMVHDAAWVDLDGDRRPDLIVLGEWMPVTVLLNRNGTFADATTEAGLQDTKGWWRTIQPVDIDGDGDMDFVAGNLGLNTRLKVSASEPLRIYAKDFDGNGSMDALISCFIKGFECPLPQRDLLLSQLPSLKKKFVRNGTYAEASIRDLYPESVLSTALRKESTLFASCLVRNNGNGTFSAEPLPIEAQVAPVQDVLPLVASGNTDILLIGNSYQTEVETGLYDAFNGLLMRNRNGQLKSVALRESGFAADGDGRRMALLRLADGRELVVAAFNDGPVRTYVRKATSHTP